MACPDADWVAGLTPLTERETPRGPAAHAFAEPLIGLIEFVRASTATVEERRSALWRARIYRDTNLFLMETTPDGTETASSAP